jgi:tetratricopeptide (TPR) repeat protein
MEGPVLENFGPATAFRCEVIPMNMLDVQNQDPIPMEINNWPFDWASVNITGPTGLMELFRGLEIDCANSVPQPISYAQSPEEPTCISNSELQSLWGPHNHSKAPDMDYIPDSPKQSLARSVPQPLKGSFLKDPSMIFFSYTESPYNELYGFPSSHRTIIAKPAKPGLTLWAELEAQELGLQSKLRVLKKQSLSIYHPGIIATTEELAGVCFREAKYKKAETLYRQVVSARLKAPGTTPLEMLASCMGVVDALRKMDKYRQAQTLLRKIMGALQKLVNPEHQLAINALHALGQVAIGLEDYKQAEDLLSQVLQVKLSKWGPRHLESWMSIRSLGYLLTYMRRIDESERLLRTSLQLYDEVEGVKEIDVCAAMCELSWTLYWQQSYEESASLARQALERSEQSLGPLHQITLGAQYTLALNLMNMGRLSESEELLQRTYRQQSKILGCKDIGTVNTAYALAIVVRKQGRMEEAIELYKEVFRVRVDVQGPVHSSTKQACAVLGRCYEDRGFYQDAVELYTEFVEKLREEEGDESPEIMDYESWIAWNQERIQERNERTSEKKDETGEHDKTEEDDQCQEEGESNEDVYHSRGGVEEVEEDGGTEGSERIAGAEGVCSEGETLSEEELWSFVAL